MTLLVSCEKPEDVKVLPTITTREISDITKFTATSGGNVIFDGGKMVTECGVCWDTTILPLATINKTIDGVGECMFTSLITSLKLNTTYYVRAYATTTNGTGYGDIIKFKTNPATPPKLGITTFTNISQTSVSWTCSIVSDGGAPVLKMGVRWGKAIPATYPNHWTIPTIWNHLDVNNLEGIITGLSPNTIYYLQPYATNYSGIGYSLWRGNFRTL